MLLLEVVFFAEIFVPSRTFASCSSTFPFRWCLMLLLPQTGPALRFDSFVACYVGCTSSSLNSRLNSHKLTLDCSPHIESHIGPRMTIWTLTDLVWWWLTASPAPGYLLCAAHRLTVGRNGNLQCEECVTTIEEYRYSVYAFAAGWSKFAKQKGEIFFCFMCGEWMLVVAFCCLFKNRKDFIAIAEV